MALNTHALLLIRVIEQALLGDAYARGLHASDLFEFGFRLWSAALHLDGLVLVEIPFWVGALLAFFQLDFETLVPLL